MAQLRGRDYIGNKGLKNWHFLVSGGFGFVYTAEHKDWGKVAVKLPHDDGQENDHLNVKNENKYLLYSKVESDQNGQPMLALLEP